MNRRSARNRHRRIVPWNGVTGIIKPSFNRAWHAAQLRRLEDERISRRSDVRPAKVSPAIRTALLLASMAGGR